MHSWRTARRTAGISLTFVLVSGALMPSTAHAAGTDVTGGAPGKVAEAPTAAKVVKRDIPVRSTPKAAKPHVSPEPGEPKHPSANHVVADLVRTDLRPFSMFGVTWKGGLPAEGTIVEARWRSDGAWSPWTELDVELAPGEGGLPGTEPQWVGSADAADVRVLSKASARPADLSLVMVEGSKAGTATSSSTSTSSGTADVTPAATVSKPPIILRAAWGAAPQDSCDSPRYGSTTRGAVLHHTAGSNSYTKSQSASIVKATQAYHMKGRGWCDIGYNFLVDRYGQIFEGRAGGIDKPVRAAHSGNDMVNQETMGVSMMGTFSTAVPPDAMKTAVVNLVSWRFAQYGIPAKGTYSIGGKTLNRIAGHRNVVSTECPGAKAYAWLTSTASTGLRSRVATVLANGTPIVKLPTPSGLTITGRTASSLSVDWDDVAGAQRYHVKVSTSSTMSSPVFGKFTESKGTVTGLKPGTTYYVSVAVVDPTGTTRLSDYTAAPHPSAKTYAVTTPANLRVVSSTPTSLSFDWDDVPGAEKYHVKVSTSSTLSSPIYGKFLDGEGTVTGLKPGTKYYFAIAVIDPVLNARLTPYTSAPYPSASTPSTTGAVTTTSNADNTVTVPSSRSISFAGHGYGHGIGMSQYGAEGAARAGKTYTTILSRYYPGTSVGSKTGNIRVLISADTTDSVLVKGESGLKIVDVSGKRTIGLPTTIGGKTVARWQIVRTEGSTTKSKLMYRTTGDYVNYQYNGSPLTWSGDGQFTGPTTIGLVLPGGTTMDLRGAVRSAKPSSTSSQRNTVNVVSIEGYVRGVIAAEMPSSWHAEALKAQAVAARTYGVRSITSSRYYDICSTTACQVYGGVSREAAASNSAVKATSGKILTYQGTPAFTQFSSSSGGYTNVGSQPYLKAVSDAWDNWSGNANHSWSRSVTASTIEKAYTSIGTLKSMAIVKRNGNGDMGGRVLSLKLVGSKGTKTITGTAARSAFGLKSDWFGF